MCTSCGCKSVNDDHGDSRRITMKTLRRAAEADESTVDTVTENICDSVVEQTAANQTQQARAEEPRQYQVPEGKKEHGEVQRPPKPRQTQGPQGPQSEEQMQDTQTIRQGSRHRRSPNTTIDRNPQNRSEEIQPHAPVLFCSF